MNKTYVPGMGPRNPKIVICGEAPGYEEIRQLKPFVGPSGKLLNTMLESSGINRSDCWVTNACKYYVRASAKGKNESFQFRAREEGIDVDKELDNLRKEITDLKPNLIIALGSTALWALTGKDKINSYRGSLMMGFGRKLIPTYHPAHILHQSGDVSGYWTKQILRLDLMRAQKESDFPELNLPYRNLNVCKSLVQLDDFIQRHKDFPLVSVDIEAQQCIPICVGIACNNYEGLTIPLWNADGISSMSYYEIAHCWIKLAELLQIKKVIGQNFGYDRDKLARLGIQIKNFHADTMLKAFVWNPELPKNLAFLTSIFTREPFYKNEGMYEGSVNDLLIGCARDACVTFEVNEELDKELIESNKLDYYNQFVHKLHSVYHFAPNWKAIEQIGFRIDTDKRRELIQKYVEHHEKIAYQLYTLTGKHVNTASPKQISELLYHDLKIPERSGTGEEVLTTVLNSLALAKSKDYEKKSNIISLILEDRRVKKTLSSYLYSAEDFDGRMRTSYFLALKTCRSSTQQQEPPIRPKEIYRDAKKVKKLQSLGMAFQTITKHGDIGADVRKMLVPDKGKVLLNIDSSQAEARVIFLLAEDYEALKLIDEIDYHALTATWFVGGTINDWSKKVLGYEHPNRFLGKTLRHACHLGASSRRAAIEVNTQARKYKIPISISEARARAAINTFHSKQPRIRQVFQQGIINCLEQDRRKLRAPVPYGVDAIKGAERTFFERWGDDLFREAFSFIPQCTVSENTKGAALRLKKQIPDLEILVEAHDALTMQVEINDANEIAKLARKEMEVPIDFSACSLKRGTLVIPSDIEIGDNYLEMEKFKFTEELVANGLHQ